MTQVPAAAPVANVVQLHADQRPEDHGTDAPIAANPRARDYEGASTPPDPAVEAVRARAAEVAASLPAFGSHGPVPLPGELEPPATVEDNPFGDFFADGPSAWLEDDDDDVVIEKRRVAGTMLAIAAIGTALAAWTTWGIGIYRGAGGAEAGGFVLISMLLWVWYLNLPREQQHAALLRRHQRLLAFVDRRVTPIRERTEGQLTMRRERDRYRAMRDERTRRVTDLGEGAYRAFRHGSLPAELQPGAQRVLAIERLMLGQDQRIAQLQRERDAARTDEGTDPAAERP